MSTLFAFLHHLAAFTLVAAVAIEFILLRGPLTLASAKLLPPVDAVLGAAAGILLAVGLARMFWFEKGAAYYFANHAFLTKFGLFLVIGLLSIVPTLEFLSWRKALRQGRLPDIKPGKIKSIRTILHVELAGVVIILLCAALMARGGWV